MDLADAAITTLVVGVVGALVSWGMSGKFRALERELDARFTAVDQRFDQVDRRFERVEASVDNLRSDITQIALALGTRPRAENG